MKYIVMRVTGSQGDEHGPALSLEIPFIFPTMLTHSIVAVAMKAALAESFKASVSEPISAGFINITGRCYGLSESLNLASRPEDTSLIHGSDYGSCIL